MRGSEIQRPYRERDLVEWFSTKPNTATPVGCPVAEREVHDPARSCEAAEVHLEVAAPSLDQGEMLLRVDLGILAVQTLDLRAAAGSQVLRRRVGHQRRMPHKSVLVHDPIDR
jgi:hypothetical protein